jgi:hypothetical protein
MTLPHFFLILKFILRQENKLRNEMARKRAVVPAGAVAVGPTRPAILQYVLRARAQPANPAAAAAAPEPAARAAAAVARFDVAADEDAYVDLVSDDDGGEESGEEEMSDGGDEL